MQAYIVKEESNTLTLGFKEGDPTILQPLVDILNRRSNVALVRFVDPHPELSDVMIQVNVKKGNPLDEFKDACKDMVDYFSVLKS